MQYEISEFPGFGPEERFIGGLDEVTPFQVRGWVIDRKTVGTPVVVELRSLNHRQFILADVFRPDLQMVGLGLGCSGFDVDISAWPAFGTHLTALVAGTEQELPNSPMPISYAASIAGMTNAKIYSDLLRSVSSRVRLLDIIANEKRASK